MALNWRRRAVFEENPRVIGQDDEPRTTHEEYADDFQSSLAWDETI
jgi:hypothetical protein